MSVPLSEFQAKTQQCGSIAKKCPCWSLPYLKSVPTTIGISANTAKRKLNFCWFKIRSVIAGIELWMWCLFWVVCLMTSQTQQDADLWSMHAESECFSEFLSLMFLWWGRVGYFSSPAWVLSWARCWASNTLPRFLLQSGISKWCLKVWTSIKTLLYTLFFGCKMHQMHWQFHLHWPPCCFAPDSHPSLPRSWGFSVGVLLSTCPDAGDALWQGVRNFRAFSLKKRNGDKVRCLNFCNEINEVNQTLAMIP